MVAMRDLHVVEPSPLAETPDWAGPRERRTHGRMRIRRRARCRSPRSTRPPPLPRGGRTGVPAPARAWRRPGLASANRVLARRRPLRPDGRAKPLPRGADARLRIHLRRMADIAAAR